MVAEEAKAEIEAAKDDDDDNNDLLPDGYVTVGVDDYAAPWTCDKACAALNYMLTSNTRGSVAGRVGMRGGPGAGVLLVWSLEKIACEYPKDDLVLMTEGELTEALDAIATEGLLLMYGCVRRGDGIEDATRQPRGTSLKPQGGGQEQGQQQPVTTDSSAAPVAPVAPRSESSATNKTPMTPVGKPVSLSDGKPADVALKVGLEGKAGGASPPSSKRLSTRDRPPKSPTVSA